MIPKMWQLEPEFAIHIKQTSEFKRYSVVNENETMLILGISAEVKLDWTYDWIYMPFVLITTKSLVIMEYVDRIPNHQFVMSPLNRV